MSNVLLAGCLAAAEHSSSVITADRFAFDPVVGDIRHYDADYLFVMGAERNPLSPVGAPFVESALFVHSQKYSRWLRVIKVSTAGADFKEPCGTKTWVAEYAKSEYAEPSLRATDGWRADPEVGYVSESDRYRLRYCKTAMYIERSDLQEAFARVAREEKPKVR